jgi:hypothetical protein
LANKHDDSTKGWEGSGIDENDINWVGKQVDRKALKGFGFQLEGHASDDKVVADMDEDGASGSELWENARPQGTKPLLGRGTPQSAEQTGIRRLPSGAKRRFSGAF